MKRDMPPAMRYLLLPFYGNWLKMRYGLKTKGFEELTGIEGPQVVFANHTHVQDPFFISARYPRHIRWVTGSYLFRMPMVGWLLKHWVQAVPKTQGRSDIETIRTIADALRNGDTIGLFPEGTRTWDGDIVDIVKATAKLVRLFKVPTVFINIENGYARKPRWSETDTKCPVGLTVKRILMPDEIKGMDIHELTAVVDECLAFSHDEWIKDHPEAKVPTKKIAEGVERLLYACPCCRKIGTIRSSGNAIECICGAHAAMGGDYSINGDFGFRTLHEWHEWEKGHLASLLSVPADEKIFPEERGILFDITEGKEERTLSKDFRMSATSDRFLFSFRDTDWFGGPDKAFSMDRIDSLVINAKQTVEFYYEGVQYRFRPEGRKSSLKYQELWQAYTAHKEDDPS